MKTVNVEDLTWKTLSEMKIKWGKKTMNEVIEKLIYEAKDTTEAKE